MEHKDWQSYYSPSAFETIPSGEKFEVKDYVDVQAKLATLAIRVELELEKIKTVGPYCLCADFSHKTQDNPIMPIMDNRMDQIQARNWVNKMNNPYSNTYNIGWRNHLNFSWKNEQARQSSESYSQQS